MQNTRHIKCILMHLVQLTLFFLNTFHNLNNLHIPKKPPTLACLAYNPTPQPPLKAKVMQKDCMPRLLWSFFFSKTKNYKKLVRKFGLAGSSARKF